ncbi:hypothetical protein [Rossellomorea sp. GCM10028870]|uniref:hypothetical protein n=1 Tax=Rossellomorea sp. GCM10028870 TaxID=3273426 RepID=UPI00260592C6|nr:hypothetical protein [uncultured Rossellomorea sp.]
MIGVQDEDSCGKSSLCETPQACRGGSPATRGKRSLARKSLAVLRNYTKRLRIVQAHHMIHLLTYGKLNMIESMDKE